MSSSTSSSVFFSETAVDAVAGSTMEGLAAVASGETLLLLLMMLLALTCGGGGGSLAAGGSANGLKK
jgi:hypothetical protein